MANITAFGSVSTTGILTLNNRKRLQTDLLKFKGCTVEIIIKKKNRRSNQQNRYLFGVVYKEIEVRLRELGNDIDVEGVHEFCKFEFNEVKIFGEGGEVISKKGGSTTEMNKEEMSIYVDKIILWAATFLEIRIPLPNETLTLNL